MEKIDAIYARQSVDKVDSISIESQIDFCQYETRGCEFVVFQDKGYSGKNTERPQLQCMMEAIREGKIKRVICYKLDRISRSILDFANMMFEFQEYGVEFVSCTEKFDTSTPMGRAMLNICIVFAQLERETIQQRVTDAYIARSRKGFYMGGRIPYGYKKEPMMIDGKNTSHYVIDPVEADQIKLIYSLYAKPHVSSGDVVKYLIEHDIKNTKTENGIWDRARITDMMKNPIYVKADLNFYRFMQDHGAQLHNPPEDFVGTNGCYLYSEKGAKRKTLSLEDHHIVIAPHEGIVPSDLWIKTREKCLHNYQVARCIKPKHSWLAGKIKCLNCGYALTIRRAKTKIGRYFICSRHMQTNTGCPGVGGIDATALEDAVFSQIKLKLQEFYTLSHDQKIGIDPVRQELEAKLSHVTNEIDVLIAKVSTADDILMKYIGTKIAELDTQKQELEQQIRALPKQENPLDMIQVCDCINHWDELSMDDKLSVVDALIVRIKASKTDIEIIWKI